MRARGTICALVACAVMVGIAAPVPQNSADKYYYTTPIANKLIQGIVMGTPPAYRSMRYEDVAWLEEAEAERNKMAAGEDINPTNEIKRIVRAVPEYGRWPLAETTRFARWVTAMFLEGDSLVTNIIVGYNYKTNTSTAGLPRIGWQPPYISISRSYLSDIDGDWNDGSVYVESHENGQVFPLLTNVISTVTTNWSGSWIDEEGSHLRIQTNVNYITMGMTNGTTSVHTNIWTEIQPHIEVNMATQIIQQTWYDLLFVGKQVVPYEWAGKDAGRSGPPLFLSSRIKECYDALKGARRLASDMWSGTGTVEKAYNAYQGWELKNGEIVIEDPVVYDGVPNVSLSKNFSAMSAVRSFVSDEGEETEDKWQDGGLQLSGPIGTSKFLIHTLSTPTNVFLAGGVDRIGKAILYLKVFAYHCHGETGSEGQDKQNFKSRISVRKVGEMKKEGADAKGYLCFSITFSPENYLNAAMGEVYSGGYPSVGWAPPMPTPTRNGFAQTSVNLQGEIWGAIIVIHTKPWTRLPDW